MSEPTTWALVLETAPIWYGVVRGFLSERVTEAGKDLVQEGIQEGAKSGIITAFNRLRDPEGKSFSEVFEKAGKSFLARYELDRDLAKAVIRILHHAQEKQLHELNRDVLIATIFSDTPRVAPIERYCQRIIAFDQIVAGSVETYSITEVSRALRYFFEELQRELMLSEKWRDVVVQFRSLQLQAKIAGEFDPLEMRREYLTYLRDRYQFLDLRGFSPRVSGREISLRLNEIFTDLELEEGRPYVSKYAEDELATMSEKQFFELDWGRQLDLLERRYVRLEATKPKVQLLKLSNVLTNRKVVILGEPGSGKTTLTRYLAFAIASNDYSRTGRAVEGLIPILVRVADYGRVLDKDPTLHLIDYICQELTSDFGPLLKQELEYGQCLVMLDGLDEVVEVGQRQRVAERIEDMVATCSKNRFLVTSRPIGYQTAQLAADFRHVTLRSLTEKEQEQFVCFWHKEIHARGAGKAEGAEWFEEPEALIRVLKTKPGVAKLASNPLLLTIIVLMYWRGTKLPDRRVDIYASATETLIENWPLRQRGIDLDLEQIKSILAPVALAVLSSSVSGVITERNLDSLLLEIVQEVHGGARPEVQTICEHMLRDLSEHSGIFLERGRDEFDYPVYGFLHQTFGEYLAAIALAEHWNVGKLELASYVHKARWREVILLLAGVLGTQGRAVASQFISGILALNSPFEEILHRDLLLVLECLDDDLRIKPELREGILRRGVKLLEHEVFDLRSAAMDRIKGLKGTDHEATAIELLKELLEKAKSQPKGVRRDETRLAAAEALCELGDPEFAKPIIWEISEDTETFRNIVGQVQGAVTKLRVLYWAHESLEWLANLFCAERRFRPRLLVGKSVSETFIRTADGTDIPIFDHLKDDELTALFDMLYECVSEEDIRQRIKWAHIQRQSSIDVKELLELANPQIDRQVCFLAASQLIDTECTQAGIDALQSLCSGVGDQALAATQRLLDFGEPVSELRAVRELALFSNSPEGIQLARKLAETEEKSLGIAILLLGVTKEDSPKVQWKATESLLELGLGGLGLAAAKYIAYTPGHNSRYQATEALLEAQRETGRFDEVIEILVDLTYDSYGSDREKAIARLATFRATEKITPILSRASRRSDATSQYQVARALVLGGMPEVPAGGITEEILAQRIKRLPEKNTAFCKCRNSFLELALDFIDDQLTNHDTTDGLIHGIKAVILHESGEYPEAEELLSYVSGSYEHQGDVSLFVARTWLNWGYPDRAFVVASKVLAESEVSPTIKLFAMGLIRRILLESTHEVPLKVLASSDDSNVQIRAIKNLRDCTNPEVILALHTILQNNPHDYRIRESLIRQLGEAAIPERKEILLKALNDDMGNVRAAAANALGNLGSEEVTVNLLDALADSDERVRIAASQAIQAINAPVPADVLGQALLDDTSVEVQVNAASALSLAEPDEAKPYLLKALANEVDYVRDTALRSIQQLEGSSAIPILIEELQNPSLSQKSKASVILSLAQFADKSIADIFLSFLGDRSQEVSTAAIRGLGIQGYNESTQRLCEIVAKDSNVETTVAAIKSLAQLKDDSAIPTLLQAVNHQREEVRKAAVASLSAHFLTSSYGMPEAMQLLRELLMRDESSDVRSAVVIGLSLADGAAAREILLYALLDESWQVRRAAAYALGILGDESSVPALSCALYDSDMIVRLTAAQALGLLGFTDSLDILRLALRHQQKEVRTQAALALGRIGDALVAHTIKSQVFSDSIDGAAGCLAMSYVRSDESIACLEELLRFGDPSVKRAAAQCLARVAPGALLKATGDPFIAGVLRLGEIRTRAQALHYAGKSGQASAAYEEAPAAFLDTNYRANIGMLTNLIIDSFELGYYSECVNLLKKAIELASRDAVFRLNLGIAYRIMREYDLSLKMYQESLRLKPFGSIEVSNGLGILSYAQGEEEKAIKHFNRSLQLSFDPDRSEPFERYWEDDHDIHMLTVALVGAGRGDVALQRLQSVMPVIRWAPGVITEILWDIEQLEEVNSLLPALPEILALLRTTQAELEKHRRGPLRS